jgi:Zn-dependent protease
VGESNVLFLIGQVSIETILIYLVVIFFSMGVHEFGHAAMATYWGDDTPRRNGKLTPNPLAHIYWQGFLLFLIVGVAPLGSVNINVRRMRDPRWGSFWTSFAGPLANLLLAIVAAIIFRIVIALNIEVPTLVLTFMWLTIFLNIFLFFFNLLPFVFPLFGLAPMDGWHMMFALLPGSFMRRNEVPAFIRQNIPPLANFLVEPARKWQEWMVINSYIFLFIILIGWVSPRLSIIGSLIGEPASRLAQFLLLG